MAFLKRNSAQEQTSSAGSGSAFPPAHALLNPHFNPFMNILIADDDEMIRLLLGSALTRLGHSVREARNGNEAWETWLTGQFPLIISDWMMPDLNGVDFCRRIRGQASEDYTYLILLTSRSGKSHYLEAMEAGADDFITKPFEKDEFAARIRVAERILGLHANLRAANTDLEQRVRERTAELAGALNAKSDFLSRASHELRTPMNHVLGFAQLLELDALTADQQNHVAHILTSGRRLLTLIDQILAVSKSSPEDLDFLDPGVSPLVLEMLSAEDAPASPATGPIAPRPTAFHPTPSAPVHPLQS